MNATLTRTALTFIAFLSLLYTEAACESASEKLDRALNEYEKVSQMISEEKRELAARVNDRRREVASKRAESESLLLNRSKHRSWVESKKADSESLAKQLDFISAIVYEHNADFDRFLSAAEDQRYRDRLNEARSAVAENASLESRLQLLDLSFARIEDVLNDPNFDGQAITSQGTIVDGRFLNLGATTYFLSEDETAFGEATLEANSLLPEIKPIPDLQVSQIKEALENRPSMLPMDPTQGKAREVKKAQWTPYQQVQKAGKVGLVIIVIALVASFVALIKSLQFLRSRKLDTVNTRPLLNSLASSTNGSPAEHLQALPREARWIMESVVNHHNSSKEILQERLLGQLEFAKRKFESALPILAITAATAPLLGLLGTVVGMIKTFALINVYGSGEAKAFSAGISEALITTEFGLVVAIPALIVHGFLLRAAKRRQGHLEDIAADAMIQIEQSKGESSHA